MVWKQRKNYFTVQNIRCFPCSRWFWVSLKSFVAVDEVNILYSVGFPGWPRRCRWKSTKIKPQNSKDQEVLLPLEKNVTGGILDVMGDRNIKSTQDTEIAYFNAHNKYTLARSHSLSYNDIGITNHVSLRENKTFWRNEIKLHRRHRRKNQKLLVLSWKEITLKTLRTTC